MNQTLCWSWGGVIYPQAHDFILGVEGEKQGIISQIWISDRKEKREIGC